MYENGKTTPCPKAVLQANDTLLLYSLKIWYRTLQDVALLLKAIFFTKLPASWKLEPTSSPVLGCVHCLLGHFGPDPISRTSFSSDPIGSRIHSVGRLDPMNQLNPSHSNSKYTHNFKIFHPWDLFVSRILKMDIRNGFQNDVLKFPYEKTT